jgi:hypothetical protein
VPLKTDWYVVQGLKISEDGMRVRRVTPVPEYNIEDMQRRMLVVENLPLAPTIGRYCLHHSSQVAMKCALIFYWTGIILV